MKKQLLIIFFVFTTSFVFAVANPSSVKKVNTQKSNNNSFPEWVTNPASAYNEKLYLIGVGFGSDDNAAEDDAKAELIKILDQQILSTENVKNYADKNDDFSIYTANIDISSEVKSISGLRIAEKFHASESNVYALAILKRQDISDYYAKLIKKNDLQIAEYMNFAKSSIGTLESCVYAQRAFDLGKDNEYYSFLETAVKAPFEQEQSFSYKSFANLSKEVSQIKKNVCIKIQVANDDKNLVKNSILNIFTKLGTLTTESNTNQYIVNADIELEQVDSPDKKHVFYNYFITINLCNAKTLNTINSFSSHGRVGHLNLQGAKNKAYLSITKSIESNYYNSLMEYIKTSN